MASKHFAFISQLTFLKSYVKLFTIDIYKYSNKLAEVGIFSYIHIIQTLIFAYLINIWKYPIKLVIKSTHHYWNSQVLLTVKKKSDFTF